MKTTEIEIPAGCKIAKTEVIDGKLIVTYERDLPESVRDIPNRAYWIHAKGSVEEDDEMLDLFQFSSKERAEAILALGQLLELAAYVGCQKFHFSFLFALKDKPLSDAFKEKYSELFQKAKKLL